MVQELPIAHKTIAALFVLASLVGRTHISAERLYERRFSHHPNWYLMPQSPRCGELKDESFFSFSTRIGGGRDARETEFPWAVKYYEDFDKEKIPSCGGAIINEYYIITAAHCCNYYNETKIMPKIGAAEIQTKYKTNPPEMLFTATEVIMHAHYTGKPRWRNDVCLVRVNKKILFGDWYQPICLPYLKKFRSENINGTTMDFVGWGFVDSKTEIDPLVLQKTQFPVYDFARYKKIAAYGEAGFIGMGDSGSPLWLFDHETNRAYLRGVASTVTYLNNNRVRHDFPNILYYLKWILDNIKP